MRLEKFILFFGQRARVACDAECSKAWGKSRRPRVEISRIPGDWAWRSDDELGKAPRDPGTYEGGQGKPTVVFDSSDMNKWCVRECERCVMTPVGRPCAPLVLRDFSKRVYNIPRSDHGA